MGWHFGSLTLIFTLNKHRFVTLLILTSFWTIIMKKTEKITKGPPTNKVVELEIDKLDNK